MARTRAASATKNDASETEKAPKPPKYHPCKCLTGTKQHCGEETTRAFARGHDARMSSRIAQAVVNGTMTEKAGLELITDAGGSELLVSKTKHSIHLRQEKRADSDGKPAPSRRGKAAGANKTDTPAVGRSVTVEHSDTGKRYKAAVVRNAGGELKARHRLQGKDCDHEVEV